MKKIEIINKKFGSLTVISKHSNTRNGHIRYTCLCDCGETINALGMHIRNNKITSCGCLRPKGSKNKFWEGVGEMSGDFWYTHIVRSASGVKGKRGVIDLLIDKQYAWDLFLSQNRQCALSGIVLKFPDKSKDKSWTASLDRIDSGIGYIPGNVQWVHKDINIMKNRYNNDYFINICKLISNNKI